MSQDNRKTGKIDVLCFNFVECGLFLGCVGSREQIQNMRAYEHFRKELHNKTALSDYINRALSNDLFCYFSGETISGKLLAWNYNRKVAKLGKKINEVHWMEAVVLVSPKAVSEKLGVSLGEINALRKESMWANKFDINE